MKWIKASERLPPQVEWPELHYNFDGVIADGQILENEDAGIIWFEYKKGTRYIQEEDLSRVEWLDESTPAEDWVIEFGNHLQCDVSVTNNQITVLSACNGWGDQIPLEQIKILPSPPKK